MDTLWGNEWSKTVRHHMTAIHLQLVETLLGLFHLYLLSNLCSLKLLDQSLKIEVLHFLITTVPHRKGWFLVWNFHVEKEKQCHACFLQSLTLPMFFFPFFGPEIHPLCFWNADLFFCRWEATI